MKSVFLIALICGAALLPAEIVDRIAVAVGNRVITSNDIERQARVSAFLSGVKPDLSPEGKRKTAEAMVDQKLVSRELEMARYPEPDASEVDDAFAEFKSQYFASDSEYQAALREYGLTEAEVKEQLLYQRRFLNFIGARFRPAAQIGDAEIREYFEKTVLPAAKAANPDATFTVDEFRDQIVAKLMGDRVDQEIGKWLAEARRRTTVVFHEEAFR